MDRINALLVIGIIMIIGVLVYLLYWNFSERVISALLSIIFSGTALLLTTILIALKAESKNVGLIEYIILDPANNLPIKTAFIESDDAIEKAKEKHGKNGLKNWMKLIFNSATENISSALV